MSKRKSISKQPKQFGLLSFSVIKTDFLTHWIDYKKNLKHLLPFPKESFYNEKEGERNEKKQTKNMLVNKGELSKFLIIKFLGLR